MAGFASIGVIRGLTNTIRLASALRGVEHPNQGKHFVDGDAGREQFGKLFYKKSPVAFLQSGFVVVEKSGNTYFRTGGHYHRLR